MPQLNKRGNWIFGWVIVGPQREITFPPEVYLVLLLVISFGAAVIVYQLARVMGWGV